MEREISGEPGGVDARPAILTGQLGRTGPGIVSGSGGGGSKLMQHERLYRQGHAKALRALYDYWRLIAEDVRERARIAPETYRQLHFRASA